MSNVNFAIVALEESGKKQSLHSETKNRGIKYLNISVFIGRTDVEAEIPILWPLDAKS